ncbi:MAG: glycosyltransferase, partial [Sarcina sp.]
AKNHKFIIEVFSQLIKEDKNYRLFLCGDGHLKAEMEQKVKELNIESYVYFLGVREDINRILLGTDIFFMPSILEGLPVTLVEAQAAGCKCLISENIPREVDMGNSLIYVESLDGKIQKWTGVLKNIAVDKISFEKRKEAIISKGYDLDNNIKVLMKIYSKDE